MGAARREQQLPTTATRWGSTEDQWGRGVWQPIDAHGSGDPMSDDLLLLDARPADQLDPRPKPS